MKERGGTDSEVTQTSTSAISICSSSRSAASVALSPLTAAVDVPFNVLCAPLARVESAGAAARSETWREREAEGEWWYRTGGPE